MYVVARRHQMVYWASWNSILACEDVLEPVRSGELDTMCCVAIAAPARLD